MNRTFYLKLQKSEQKINMMLSSMFKSLVHLMSVSAWLQYEWNVRPISSKEKVKLWTHLQHCVYDNNGDYICDTFKLE